jgi:HSP20 family protein
MAFGNLVRHPGTARRGSFRDFDRLVDDLWSGFGLTPVAFAPTSNVGTSQSGFTPRFEATELEDAYRVTADVPGVDPADVEVKVEDGVLTIRGHRHYYEGEDESEFEEGGVQKLSEHGRFERRIRFPGDIVETGVKAVHKHGVLTVTIPKPAEQKPEVRNVPVETS